MRASSFLFTVLLAAGLAASARAEDKLKPGDPAPKFEAKDQEGKTWKLEDLAGKKNVLVYFYPKDETPGCTKEACGFRDRVTDLQKENTQVLGVSFDSAESHQKFIEKHSLNFPLLVDTDGKIADLYGARMPGKNMARRVSFLIGKDGKIAHITDVPSADKHLEEMKEAVAALKK
jgi:peroxiredoxin Q/BCP